MLELLRHAQAMSDTMIDLNHPYEGDLARYNGVLWVFTQGKWVLLEEAMKVVYEVGLPP